MKSAQTFQAILSVAITVAVGAQAIAIHALQRDVITFVRTIDLLGSDQPLVEMAAGPIQEGDGPVLGAADAPVTIVAYSDYDCPACQKMMPDLHDMVVAADSELRLEYRHFPIRGRGAGLRRAMFAECAFRQHAFWPMHQRLLDQDDITLEAATALAGELGLDTIAFDTCVASPEARARVDSDKAAGTAFGVEGTPTLFINGRKVAGSISPDVLALIIRQIRAAT